MPVPTLLIMATLCNRAGHYIFALWFLSSIFLFFSSPNLSGRRLDVYHTSTLGCCPVSERLAKQLSKKKLPLHSD